MMPSHIGSSPMASRIGPTIGTTTKVISIKSRIKPSRKITSITTSVAPITPPGMSTKKLWINSSPPKPRKTSEKTAAPIRIINTIQVTPRVSITASRSLSNVSCPRSQAKISAPIAPNPAASVGVAAPSRMEPRTRNISNSGGSSPCSTSHTDTSSPTAGGADSGLRCAYTVR